MIVRWIKEKVEQSLSYEIFYKVKAISIIRLFFDFDYAARVWDSSYTGKGIKRLFSKTGIYEKNGLFFLDEKYLPYLICFCIGLLLFDGYTVIPATFFTGALLLPHTKSRNFGIVLCLLLIMTGVLALTVPLSALFYILYVETGILLFYIIKYLPEGDWNRFLSFLPVLWLGAAFLSRAIQNAAVHTVVFMPYVLTILKRGKIRKYLYAAVILALGFYILSNEGRGAVIGGSLGVILMIISGELWIIVPAALSAPAVISFAIGLINRNFIETSYFLWRYGFSGGVRELDVFIQNGVNVYIISIISFIGGLVFFWYVLRLCRSVLIKLFKKEEKNKSLLRSAFASVVGFSVYTFFAYNENFAINIIMYLISAAILRRAGYIGRITEETGENGRKKDLSKKMRPDIPFQGG